LYKYSQKEACFAYGLLVTDARYDVQLSIV